MVQVNTCKQLIDSDGEIKYNSFFRIYKIPDGKPENKFAFDGEFQNADFANKIISETHEYWKQLVGKFDSELTVLQS